jgi:hypothetical protein
MASFSCKNKKKVQGKGFEPIPIDPRAGISIMMGDFGKMLMKMV